VVGFCSGAGLSFRRDIRLRPALPDDEEFLFAASKAARGSHVVETYGSWDEAEQRQRFASRVKRELDRVIEIDATPIGCLAVDWQRDHARLVRIYLVPEAQGNGIGSHLVLRVIAKADALGVPVRLRVLRVNRAFRLWRRLGFVVAGESDTHWSMECNHTGPVETD